MEDLFAKILTWIPSASTNNALFSSFLLRLFEQYPEEWVISPNEAGYTFPAGCFCIVIHKSQFIKVELLRLQKTDWECYALIETESCSRADKIQQAVNKLSKESKVISLPPTHQLSYKTYSVEEILDSIIKTVGFNQLMFEDVVEILLKIYESYWNMITIKVDYIPGMSLSNHIYLLKFDPYQIKLTYSEETGELLAKLGNFKFAIPYNRYATNLQHVQQLQKVIPRSGQLQINDEYVYVVFRQDFDISEKPAEWIYQISYIQLTKAIYYVLDKIPNNARYVIFQQKFSEYAFLTERSFHGRPVLFIESFNGYYRQLQLKDGKVIQKIQTWGQHLPDTQQYKQIIFRARGDGGERQELTWSL